MKNKTIELLVLPTIENIEEIAKNISAKFNTAYFSEIEFKFKNNIVSITANGRDIKTFSLVWLSSYWGTRDLATAIKLYLDNFDIPNTYVEHSTSKLTDIMNFTFNNLRIPDTYFVKNSVMQNHLDDIEEVCGYPMIMKDVKGCGGLNSSFISCSEDLVKSITDRNQSKSYIFQKFIENDYDWGVLVANNKIVSAERSYPVNGEFRNNAKAGAREVFVELSEVPDEVKEIALNGARTLGLSWSRADIIVEKNTQVPYLLEVNRFPGITSKSTEVSGATTFLETYLEIYNIQTDNKKRLLELYNSNLKLKFEDNSKV